MVDELYVKFCPHCSSSNVTMPPAGMDLLMSVPDYCRDCQAMGVFPERQVSK